MAEEEMKTMIGEDVPVTVLFDYSPPEEQTPDCPASAAEIHINEVDVKGVNILDRLSEGITDELVMKCFEYLEKKYEDN